MQKKHRTSAFTLIEVLVSVMLSGMILTAAYSAFQGIIKSEIRLGGVIDIQRNLFYLNEKLAYLIHNGGTVDYEEYFNRRILGYNRTFYADPGSTTTTPIPPIYTFSPQSTYGNGNSSGKPEIFLCTKDASINTDACLGAGAVKNKTGASTTIGGQQAYRQYREIAFNYGSTLPTPTKLPSIFPPLSTTATDGIPELYLIKKMPDGSYERIYFRHIFIQDPNKDETTDPCKPNINTDNCLGKIQMTRLKSCDNLKADGTAGSDGTIDMWVPYKDFSKSGDIVCSSMTDFSKALTDLTWVDVSTPDMNITKALFLPVPDKIPSLMAGTGEIARSPIVQVHIEVRLSESLMRRGLLDKTGNTPRILMTTFDLSDN